MNLREFSLDVPWNSSSWRAGPRSARTKTSAEEVGVVDIVDAGDSDSEMSIDENSVGLLYIRVYTL